MFYSSSEKNEKLKKMGEGGSCRPRMRASGERSREDTLWVFIIDKITLSIATQGSWPRDGVMKASHVFSPDNS